MEWTSICLLAPLGVFYDGKVHPATWDLRTTHSVSPNLHDIYILEDPLGGHGNDASAVGSG